MVGQHISLKTSHELPRRPKGQASTIYWNIAALFVKVFMVITEMEMLWGVFLMLEENALIQELHYMWIFMTDLFIWTTCSL